MRLVARLERHVIYQGNELTAWDVLSLFLAGCSDRSDDGATSLSSSIDTARSGRCAGYCAGAGQTRSRDVVLLWASNRPLGAISLSACLLQDSNLGLGSAQQPRIDPRRTGRHRHGDTQTHSRSRRHVGVQASSKDARLQLGPGLEPGAGTCRKKREVEGGKGCSGDKERIKTAWDEHPQEGKPGRAPGSGLLSLFIIFERKEKLNWNTALGIPENAGKLRGGYEACLGLEYGKGAASRGKKKRCVYSMCVHVIAGNPATEIYSFRHAIPSIACFFPFFEPMHLMSLLTAGTMNRLHRSRTGSPVSPQDPSSVIGPFNDGLFSKPMRTNGLVPSMRPGNLPSCHFRNRDIHQDHDPAALPFCCQISGSFLNNLLVCCSFESVSA